MNVVDERIINVSFSIWPGTIILKPFDNIAGLKEDKIINFGYQTASCIYCQASASLLSKISINSKKDKIVKLCDDAKLFFYKDKKKFNDNLKLFSNLFIEENLARKDCILLPFKALKKIVSN